MIAYILKIVGTESYWDGAMWADNSQDAARFHTPVAAAYHAKDNCIDMQHYDIAIMTVVV